MKHIHTITCIYTYISSVFLEIHPTSCLFVKFKLDYQAPNLCSYDFNLFELSCLWIVLRVHSNQGRNSKATLVLLKTSQCLAAWFLEGQKLHNLGFFGTVLSHLSSWAFGCHHDHCKVLQTSNQSHCIMSSYGQDFPSQVGKCQPTRVGTDGWMEMSVKCTGMICCTVCRHMS